MSTDLPSRRQYALNLRESFVELEQKNMLTRSRKDLKINEAEEALKEVKELKQQLEEARNQLQRLMTEVNELRDENFSLKQMLGANGSSKDAIQLRQRLEFLQNENKRL